MGGGVKMKIYFFFWVKKLKLKKTVEKMPPPKKIKYKTNMEYDT